LAADNVRSKNVRNILALTYRIFAAKYNGLVDREPMWYLIAIPLEDNFGICHEVVNDLLAKPSSIQIL
jgi:hypothetical protein